MTNDLNNLSNPATKAILLGSLLDFTRVFYKLRTGRKFIISEPKARESHHLIISRELTNVFRLESNKLIINVAPGSGKSELCRHFIAWALARYPDSNFLYISFSHERAAANTAIIRDILQLPAYRKLFDVSVNPDFSARDNFKTTRGGTVIAFGSSGSITGADAGLPNLDRFSGAVIMDDMHKPDEVFSDGIRESVIQNYENTIVHRARGKNVPFVFIGQRLHEDDLPSYLIAKQPEDWRTVILKTRDERGHLLYPEVYTDKMLDALSPYSYAAQHQQNPIPAGGGIYKKEWFTLLDDEPDILVTFITVDTAETDKSYNDATVFSFWGLYKVTNNYADTDTFALHWIDCSEIRVEPADLEAYFRDFYAKCLRHKDKPSTIAIEKKSMGVMLCSLLKRVQGLHVDDIDRTKASGSKTTRFLEMQGYVKQGLISLPRYGDHTEMCIDHMIHITDNNAHKHDDVCLAAGTKISTLFGYKNIEDIKINDYVITPLGIDRVISCGLTKKNAQVIYKFGLIATPKHKTFCSGGFLPLDTLSDDSDLDIMSIFGILKWRYKKLLFSMASNTDLWGREGIILVSQQTMQKEGALKDCMWRFGNFIVEKKFIKAMSFITKMAIILITTTLTFAVFQIGNIYHCMLRKGRVYQNPISKSMPLRKCREKLKNGIKVKKGGSGIESTLKMVFIAPFRIIASFVAKRLRLSLHVQSIAAKNALECTMQEKHEGEERRDVYNLTAEKYGVYYGDDILLSNCDTLYDAVKIALIDKVIERMYINRGNLENKKSVNFIANYNSSINRARENQWHR